MNPAFYQMFSREKDQAGVVLAAESIEIKKRNEGNRSDLQS